VRIHRNATRKRCPLCKELHEYTLSCGILHESSIPMFVIPLHIKINVISQSHGMRKATRYPYFRRTERRIEWERRTNMRKALGEGVDDPDGVFDADTMDHCAPADEAAVNGSEEARSTLWRSTRKAMCTCWDGPPMKCCGRAWSTQTTGDASQITSTA